MKKIRLNLEELDVESFSAAPEADAEGTVLGYATGVEDCGWSFVGTSCGDTVWEAGCSFVTAPLDCSPTEGGYAWCQTQI
ncbi:MAG TPA: hypothetical protein VF771_09450 [Longimicrobiaceae bacterium]